MKMSDVSFIGIYKNIFLKTETTLVFLNWSYLNSSSKNYCLVLTQMRRFLKTVKTEMVSCKKGNNFHLLLFCLYALLFKVKKV